MEPPVGSARGGPQGAIGRAYGPRQGSVDSFRAEGRSERSSAMLRSMHTKMRIAVALAVAAMLALPGEAKTVDGAAALPSAGADSGAVAGAEPQATFGLFLDPHAEPVLHIVLPQGYWRA